MSTCFYLINKPDKLVLNMDEMDGFEIAFVRFLPPSHYLSLILYLELTNKIIVYFIINIQQYNNIILIDHVLEICAKRCVFVK